VQAQTIKELTNRNKEEGTWRHLTAELLLALASTVILSS
jgi:hypothetical protein